jgi:NAD(P)-dependent dehydrogenase (short-subunit alcohol dehydrogenase family)
MWDGSASVPFLLKRPYVKVDRRKFLQLGAGAAASPAIMSCTGSVIDDALPLSSFGAESTAEEVTEGLNLKGKLAVVTGCNSGIGYETMRVLALRGAYVIGTGRTMEKATEACNSVAGATAPAILELSDYDSVRACADRIDTMGIPVDILICNAGITGSSELEVANGVERTFVVNHLGHFILVNRLIRSVRRAEQGRVVMVSSQSAYRQAPDVGIDFDNLAGEAGYKRSEAYGRSKLANALMSLELAKRERGTRVTSNAVHPGWVMTNIARDRTGLVRFLYDNIGPYIAKDLAAGAATSCYVATSPALADVSGAFFEDCNPVKISGRNYITDGQMAARLWSVSRELTQGYLI